MKDHNKNKRIKMLRKMQGLPTVGDILIESGIFVLLLVALYALYLVVKFI